MRVRHSASILFIAAFAALALSPAQLTSQQLQYPQTKKVDQVDTYFGVKVGDPYRWLEDDNSPETARWVEAQNKVTYGYLEKIPFRQQVKQRLENLYNYPKYGAPYRKGEYYIFSKNDGLQNQSVMYIQKGLDGKPEVLIDPNKLSADGTARLGTLSFSKDGRYAVVGVSRSGSDWQDFYVMEVATRKYLPDTLLWTKFSGASWQGDGFYYSRYDPPEKGKELSSKNVNQKVYFHKLHTPQSTDELVYEDRAHPERMNGVGTTQDERFAILFISESGSGKQGNALYYRDLSKGEKTFQPIVSTISDDSYGVIDNIGDKFLVRTNKNAPNGMVVLVDPKNPEEKNWKKCTARETGAPGGHRDCRRKALCNISQGCVNTRLMFLALMYTRE